MKSLLGTSYLKDEPSAQDTVVLFYFMFQQDEILENLKVET